MSEYQIVVSKRAPDGVEWDALTTIECATIYDLERALTEWATSEIPDAIVTVLSDGSQTTTVPTSATDTEVT